MKIVLEAFNGRMKSEPMDVPENTMPTFKMLLAGSPTAIVGYSGTKIDEIPKMNTMCTFERTGRSYLLEDNEAAEIYVLRDIEKR